MKVALITARKSTCPQAEGIVVGDTSAESYSAWNDEKYSFEKSKASTPFFLHLQI
jgi:hypothetical protein